MGTFVAADFLSFVPDVAEKLSQDLTGVLYGAVMLGAVFVLPLLSKWRGRMAGPIALRYHPWIPSIWRRNEAC